MLFGLILRNYKSYQAINYIPLSNGKLFSAIVGENGAGKSSVLEALDSYFNNTEWNLNHSLSKGFQEREPFICPIFLIKKDKIQSKPGDEWFLEGLSTIIWTASTSDFNPAVKSVAERFCNHRSILKDEGITQKDHYLLPIGMMKSTQSSSPEFFFSIFEYIESFQKLMAYSDSIKGKINLFNSVSTLYKYIYLPSEIDFKEYTKIEGTTIQALLGKRIDEIVRGFIKKSTIQDINKKLNEFLQQISKTLENYEYRKPSRKQTLFNQSHFTEKVIEAFFESKVLTKINEKETVPVTNLSSGEKRQALIDVARAFLLSANQDNAQQTILAIDEPELSLHISSCFEQFEKLKDITESGVQTLITTHWYGFMPAISNGVAVYCPKTDGDITLIDLRCFREEITKLKKSTKGKLPTEIELKGINDLVQSIIASITGSDYKWIICEGSSDKIYLDFYFSDQKIYILPVGGSKFVKKIYKYIEMALEDNRDDIQGKAFLIVDTDKNFEKFESRDSLSQIKIKRLQNSEKEFKTQLLSTSNTEYHPPTVIEDTLNAEHFLNALLSFSGDKTYGSMIKEFKGPLAIEDNSWPSTLALNLRASDARVLEKLFKEDGFKIKFALKYTSIADPHNPPDWIKEVREFLFTKPPRKLPSGSTRTGKPKPPKAQEAKEAG